MSDEALAKSVSPFVGDKVEVNGVTHIGGSPAYVDSRSIERLVDRGWMSRKYADNLLSMYPDEETWRAKQSGATP